MESAISVLLAIDLSLIYLKSLKRSLLQNYHIISIISIFPKAFELLTYVKLSSYFEYRPNIT